MYIAGTQAAVLGKKWPKGTIGDAMEVSPVPVHDARNPIGIQRSPLLRSGRPKKQSLRNEGGMIDRIERDLAGRLTEEQRPKLLEIAQRCPVHRTLVFEIDIRMRVPLSKSPDALA
jgi:hypothetical protein